MPSRAVTIQLVLTGVAAALLAGAFFVFGSAYTTEAPNAQIPKESRTATILFVGDMFFDRSVRTVAAEKGYDYLFSCIKDRLFTYDAVIGNLEGPITDKKSVSVGSVVGSWQNYTFTFAPEVADLLARHNFKVVSLGNNHIGNMGVEGVRTTREYLEQAGVAYFGGVAEIDEVPTDVGEPVYRTEVAGEQFSFVAYNQFGGVKPEVVAAAIAAEDQSRIIVVMAHWGEEYLPAEDYVKGMAAQFAEAGADLIIGSHPHVVQESGKLGDAIVYYSLGNFLFDQFFSEEVAHGLALEVEFAGGEIKKITEVPTEMHRDRRVCFVGSPL